MRLRIAALFAVAALGLAAAGTSAQARPVAGSVAAKHCSAGYVSASLPWGHKCLRAGEFCKVGNTAYLRYGYYCPPSGHLKRR
jgi:hypothetical protein